MITDGNGPVRLYLAGPMRHREFYNFPAFDAEALRLRREGFTVVSPAEMDRVNGVHEFTPELPPDWRQAVMRRDLVAICDCHGIALLPEWAESAGVRVELELAQFLGLDIKTVDEWIDDARETEGDTDDARKETV